MRAGHGGGLPSGGAAGAGYGIVGAACLLAGLFLSAPPAAAALTPRDFLATPAAEAFRAGDFEAALEGFEALRAAEPGDLLVLRYLAITLDRLGRHEEAIAVLREALAARPDNPALHFFLGVSAWKARQVDLAVESFRRARALAPDSAYAQKALEYLDAVERQAVAGAEPGAPPGWNLSLTAGLQYDSNVPAESRDLEDGDLRGFESLSGDVTLFESGGLKIQGQGFAYFSHHTEHDTQEFDLMVFEPGAEIGYGFQPFDIPTLASLAYAYNFTLAEGAPFSSGHEVTTAVTVRPHPVTMTRVHHQFTVEAFRNDGFNSDISSRDGYENAGGVTQYLFCCGEGQEHYIFGGYEFGRKNAEGNNFDRRTHKVIGGAGVLLPYDIRVELYGEYADDNYDNFVSTRSRETERHAGSVAVKHELFDGFTASMTYSYTDEDTNFEALDFTRHVLGIAGTYRF